MKPGEIIIASIRCLYKLEIAELYCWRYNTKFAEID